MKRFLRLIGLIIPLVVIGAVGACDGDPGGVLLPQLAILPADVSIQPGDSVQLSARWKESDGSLGGLIPEGGVTWRTSDAQIATVSQDGLVRGRTGGEVEITAGCGGQCAVASVTVGG